MHASRWMLLGSMALAVNACAPEKKEEREVDSREERRPIARPVKPSTLERHRDEVAGASVNVREIAFAAAAVHGKKRALCSSAIPVPSAPPKGPLKYVPTDLPGRDFQSGDDDAGWTCLGFTLWPSQPFQYEYRQGKGYKGPARGGPDAGSDGFEASAEADLDGDGGATTLLTITGKLDSSSGKMVVDKGVFVAVEP